MAAAATGAPRLLLGRYTHAFPSVDLFRFAGRVQLRERAVQAALKRTSFDYSLGPDGLVHPATGDRFVGPNGCSLRPAGPTLYELVAHRRGDARLVLVPAGTRVPDGLVLLHEHSDHYSLQTASPCTPAALNARLNAFFKSLPTTMSRDEYLQRYPIEAT
jgi:hypothetical protein